MTDGNRITGRHAPGTQEHTLCGMAFDAFDTGDCEEPIVFAEPGQLVTCAACQEQLDHAQKCFKRYRYIGG